MTKPKLAASVFVNVAVWVRKPYPIADVAIKKAAPISNDQLPAFFPAVFFCCSIYCSSFMLTSVLK